MVFEPKKYWTTYWNGLPCPTRTCYSAPRIIDFSRIVKDNITFMAQVYPYRGLLLFIALQKVLQLQIMVGMRRKTDQKIDLATLCLVSKTQYDSQVDNWDEEKMKLCATLCLVRRKVDAGPGSNLLWPEVELPELLPENLVSISILLRFQFISTTEGVSQKSRLFWLKGWLGLLKMIINSSDYR